MRHVEFAESFGAGGLDQLCLYECKWEVKGICIPIDG